jgi:hypothetical protein
LHNFGSNLIKTKSLICFFKIDALSLNSFSTDYDNLLEKNPRTPSGLHQRLPLETKEINHFVNRFDVLNQSNQSIATLRGANDELILANSNSGPILNDELVNINKDSGIINNVNGKSKKLPPLHLACFTGAIDQIKKLIERDHYDPMKHDHNGYLPMHYATINNQIECLKLLLNVYRCQPNTPDLKNSTVLYIRFVFYFCNFILIDAC